MALKNFPPAKRGDLIEGRAGSLNLVEMRGVVGGLVGVERDERGEMWMLVFAPRLGDEAGLLRLRCRNNRRLLGLRAAIRVGFWSEAVLLVDLRF